MMEGLKAKAQAIGRAAVARAVPRIAQAAELPADVAVAAENDRVVIVGKALSRRSLIDARLRWIGGWSRR